MYFNQAVENYALAVVMSYTRSKSQSWFVLSTVAGLPHYVHMLNFEDVHSPIDKEVQQVNEIWLKRLER